MNALADRQDNFRAPLDPYGAVTHEVFNQPVELVGINLYDSDTALKEAVQREGAGWAGDALGAFGARAGSAEFLELGTLANREPARARHPRSLRAPRRSRPLPSLLPRADESLDRGRAPFVALDRSGRGRACGAGRALLHAHASRSRPRLPDHHDLRRDALPQSCRETSPRNGCRRSRRASTIRATFPPTRKQGLTIGMAMTEKQGGSDVRANTTRAIPVGVEGPGQAYELVGHKFFVSAPMCDAFLVLAQAPGGLSCFLVPRWRPDGTKNPLQIIRLKRKMGNVSNASSETELRGALGWMVGPEGRGVATIIEMVAMTRFDCMIGSSAGMRMAVSQAIDHCRQRKAFGAFLIDQPLMTAVLADLAIEAEAALDAHHADRPRARSSRRSHTRTRWCAWARRSANTGSASGRRATPMKRSNVSAARG